jgi:glycine cleavage system aminomethyltransferase T
MAYVAPGDAAIGTMLEVEVRDTRAVSEVVPLPFYTRAR